jgi:YVTN family beta-propeller protein
VIDVARREMVDTIPVGIDPEQVVVSPDGRTLYVSNEKTNMATAVAIDSERVTFALPVGVEPEGIAVSPDGRKLYVTAETDHNVTVIDVEAK